MKKITLIASLLISAALFAQPPKDSTAKRDTVRMAYLVEKTIDTIPAIILYCGKEPRIEYSNGFVLMKGAKDKNGQYFEEPVPVGYLDKKRRPLKGKALMFYFGEPNAREGQR
jgi:hypothetical protein